MLKQENLHLIQENFRAGMPGNVPGYCRYDGQAAEPTQVQKMRRRGRALDACVPLQGRGGHLPHVPRGRGRLPPVAPGGLHRSVSLCLGSLSVGADEGRALLTSLSCWCQMTCWRRTRTSRTPSGGTSVASGSCPGTRRCTTHSPRRSVSTPSTASPQFVLHTAACHEASSIMWASSIELVNPQLFLLLA